MKKSQKKKKKYKNTKNINLLVNSNNLKDKIIGHGQFMITLNEKFFFIIY